MKQLELEIKTAPQSLFKCAAREQRYCFFNGALCPYNLVIEPNCDIYWELKSREEYDQRV